MRKLLETKYNCEYIKFNTCTQDSERQGYRCKLTNEKCVGHVTLPLPYFDVGASQWDPIGLYALLRKDIVMRCPSRELNEELKGGNK